MSLSPLIMAVNYESLPDDVVAKDPGIRTFMTTYDTNDFRTGCGQGDMKQVFSLFTFRQID